MLGLIGGWALLLPFIFLGAWLNVRGLTIVTVLVLLFDGLVWFGPGVQEAGPGTYAAYAALSVVVISFAGLVIMWASAGIAALIGRSRTKNVYEGFD